MFSEPGYCSSGQGPIYETSHLNSYNSVNPSMHNAIYNVNVRQDYYYSSVYDDNINSGNVSAVVQQSRRNDERDIENFLRKIEQPSGANGIMTAKRMADIDSSKIALASALRLNGSLKAIYAELRSNVSLAADEWREKMNACNAMKRETAKLLKTLKDARFIALLKKTLEKRKKKRIAIQRRKKRWKNEKMIKRERTAGLHAEIDSWIGRERAVIDRERQEENLRKDADLVLSDVLGKRSDARKFVGLLKELKNLHSVKTNLANARGEHLSLAADEAFHNIIDKLTEQWLHLDREYSIEEQGLKLMVKTDNEERIEKQKKKMMIFDDWENVLFGKKVLLDRFLHPDDFTTFIATRTAWDKYASCDNDASAIPVGWILPGKPVSTAWQKCLGKEAP